jgi:hypothetical protein
MANKEDIETLQRVNSADLDALNDAKFTLEAIKEADPGTYDEIINQSLRLINEALNISCIDAIERIAEQLGVEA